MILGRLQKINSVATSRKEQKRFIKFAIVGAIGAVIDILVLNFLVLVLGMNEKVANPFSVTAAIISNFTWNRLWSFPESRQRPLWPQFRQYALVNVFGLIINQTIFVLMLDHIVPRFDINHSLDYNIAKVLAIGVVLFWNFGVNRLWTYRGL